MENRKCLFCGSEFIVDEDKYKVYCSRKCKERARNKRRIKGINNIKTYHKKCEVCGNKVLKIMLQ